jgi:hypothetical protein
MQPRSGARRAAMMAAAKGVLPRIFGLLPGMQALA